MKKIVSMSLMAVVAAINMSTPAIIPFKLTKDKYIKSHKFKNKTKPWSKK